LIAENATTAASSAAISRLVDGAIALLDELLDVRRVHPRGDVPIDRADVVARVIRAHIREDQATTLEHGVVLTRELRVDETARCNLDLARLLEQLRGVEPQVTAPVGIRRRGEPRLRS
jgi:hypothetical protein